jgi:hypothetical protein
MLDVALIVVPKTCLVQPPAGLSLLSERERKRSRQ